MKESIFTLAAKLGNLLLAKQWQLSCAESCTGGGIAYAITSTSGSSAWFNQSFVTYSNLAKHQLLAVDLETLDTFGAVSQQTALEMVKGCANIAKSQVAISVTGIAGPSGGSKDKPVGTVWFGFKVGDNIIAEKMLFDGDRKQVREQSIEFALQKVLQLLAT